MARGRHVWLPLAWLVAVMLILWGRTGRFDPLGAEYGANSPGDLRTAFGFLTLDMLVLYAILRPWSYRASWQRSLWAFTLVTPWALFSMAATMHSGQILGLLAFWQLLLVPALAVTMLVSGYSAWRRRRVAAT